MRPFYLQTSRHGGTNDLEEVRDQAEAEHICTCFAFFLRLPTHMQDRWLLYGKVCAAGRSPCLGINPESEGEAWSPFQSCSPSALQKAKNLRFYLLLRGLLSLELKQVNICTHKQQRAVPVTSHWGSAVAHSLPRKVRENLL